VLDKLGSPGFISATHSCRSICFAFILHSIHRHLAQS
jgi:hypothetical protein